MHSWFVVKIIFYFIALLLFITQNATYTNKWFTHGIHLVFTNVVPLFWKLYVSINTKKDIYTT